MGTVWTSAKGWPGVLDAEMGADGAGVDVEDEDVVGGGAAGGVGDVEGGRGVGGGHSAVVGWELMERWELEWAERNNVDA